MSTKRDLVILILGQSADGLTLENLHKAVAAYEIEALSHASLRPYAKHAFLSSRREAYSHDLAVTLSSLLRDQFIRSAPEGKIGLTSSGRALVNDVLSSLMGKKLIGVKLNASGVQRRLHLLESVNLRKRRGVRRNSGLSSKLRPAGGTSKLVLTK